MASPDAFSPRRRIAEGLLLTRRADGSPHLAAMGPYVDATWDEFVFRPFPTSATYANLLREGGGTFQVTDDILLTAETALGKLRGLPPLVPCEGGAGLRLEDACRWYSVRLVETDFSGPRPILVARTVARGTVRDLWGWNRAQHAVLEAAVLATRTHLLDPAELTADLARLRPAVEKTGGERELAAYALVLAVVAERLRAKPDDPPADAT